MQLTDRMFALFFLLILGVLGYETSKIEHLQYEAYSSKMFPYLIIGFCLILVIALIINSFVAKRDLLSPKEVWGKFISKRRLGLLTAIIVYLLMMKIIGFIVSTTLFLMITILALSNHPKKDILKASAITFCVVGGVVLLVEHFLQAFLP